MSSYAKYIDRNPDVQAAGMQFKSIENIGDSLKNYSIEEAALNIVNQKCKKLHKAAQENNALRYTQFLPKEVLMELLSPELRKSRFVAFKEKFSEDMYFKKAETGKARVLHSKPSEYTNENFVYGLKNETTENLYELVFPHKTTAEVEDDFMKWHDKYLISHKHYFPAERIQRNYNDHFKPSAIYGIPTIADTTGFKVKKCIELCDRMVVINKTQKTCQDRKIGKLGEKLECNQTFGIQTKTKNNFNVQTLMENIEPYGKNTEVNEALSHVNNLRRCLFNRSNFHMNDLRAILNRADENGTGYLQFSTIMKLLRSLQVHINEQMLRTAVLHFKMFKNQNEVTELVSTEDFWKMLDIQYPLQQKIDSTGAHKICTNYSTTYHSLCSDRDKPITTSQIIPQHVIEADHTTAGELIAPDVSVRYGLSSKDFNALRPQEEIHNIFKHLLSHDFDKVWQFACTKKAAKDTESCCKMSVNQFKIYFDEYNRQLQRK